MTVKDAKKKALKELEGLKKELDGRKMQLSELESHLHSLPLFNRVIYKSQENGILEVLYSNMTLKIYVKSGIISLDEKVDLWNEEGGGFLGTFTLKTLGLECEDDLD